VLLVEDGLQRVRCNVAQEVTRFKEPDEPAPELLKSRGLASLNVYITNLVATASRWRSVRFST